MPKINRAKALITRSRRLEGIFLKHAHFRKALKVRGHLVRAAGQPTLFVHSGVQGSNRLFQTGGLDKSIDKKIFALTNIYAHKHF